MDDRQELEDMAHWAVRVHIAERVAKLGEGFKSLAAQHFENWRTAVDVWPYGELRAIPAVNAQGMPHWRHATGLELTDWVAAGARGWLRNGKRPLVVAFGSAYREKDVPALRALRGQDRSMELFIFPFHSSDTTVKARLKRLVREHPSALVLCALPRRTV